MIVIPTYRHVVDAREGRVCPIFTYVTPYIIEEMYGEPRLTKLFLSYGLVDQCIKDGRMLRIKRGTTM